MNIVRNVPKLPNS